MNGLADFWTTFSGVKGSRFIQTVGVDASGTGEDLVAAKILDNGDAVHDFRRSRYPCTHSCLVGSRELGPPDDYGPASY